MKINELTKEEINNNHTMTIGDLKKFIKKYNLPDSAKVMIQRVEDVYYEERGWKVYLKEGSYTFEDSYGNVVQESLEQYHPAWSCVKYKDEDEHLFIDLHY